MRQILEQRSGLSPEKIDTLCAFGRALLEKNQVMNLTAITEPQAVAELHFLDSIALLQAVDFQNQHVIDIGCGAGFPGVPLKIAEPSMELTLLDSLAKRMLWLEELLPQLGVQAQVVTARAEEYVRTCRESYDIVTSRAVARLNVLAVLCLPYAKVGGVFLACRRRDRRGPARHRPARRQHRAGVRISHPGRRPQGRRHPQTKADPAQIPPCIRKDQKIPPVNHHPRRKIPAGVRFPQAPLPGELSAVG